MTAYKQGWGAAKESADAHKGTSLFIRLENDGDKIIGAPVGAPLIRSVCFNEKTNKYEDWTPEQEAAGRKESPRYMMNFYVPISEDEKKKTPTAPLGEMKVIEFNLVTFKDVLKLKDKHGQTKYFLEVERSGKKGDNRTTYSVLPVPDEKISDAHLALMGRAGEGDSWIEGSLKLNDLAKAAKGGGDADDAKTDMSSHNKSKTNGTSATALPSGTIDKELVQKISQRLKALPRAAGIDKFIAKFGVTKVSEVKAGDSDSALAFVGDLEKAAAPPPAAAPAEEDPFA